MGRKISSDIKIFEATINGLLDCCINIVTILKGKAQ